MSAIDTTREHHESEAHKGPWQDCNLCGPVFAARAAAPSPEPKYCPPGCPHCDRDRSFAAPVPAAGLRERAEAWLDIPKDRAALWAKFTPGEKLAYGCGYRDARREQGGLDVERLARALHGENNAGGKFDGARCPCRKEAERVAAEYARLVTEADETRRG